MHTIALEVDWWEMIVRLIGAVVAGAIIGLDRESKGRAAGLRTHIMVALGSAALTMMALELIEAQEKDFGSASLEPVRIIAAIVGGVGFLGAGAIIHSGREVHGLTTAAGIWVIAAVGIAMGAGAYLLAALVTVLAFLTLTVLRLFEPDKSDSG